MARSRVLHVGWLHAVVAVTLLILLGAGMMWLGLRATGEGQGVAGRGVAWWPAPDPMLERQARAARASIDAMARKVGEMQARLIQLESLDERVRGLVGLPLMKWEARPGQGGILLDDKPLSMQGFESVLHDLGTQVGCQAGSHAGPSSHALWTSRRRSAWCPPGCL